LSIRKIANIAMFATLICAFTFIYVPTPWGVPITGQTLAILVAGLVLKPKDAALAVSLYLTLGIIGLPVFSGGQSGIGVLFGPTGGYLSSFLLGVLILSWLSAKQKPLLGIILFTIVVYLIGSFQLAIVTNITFLQALKVGMLPFVLGDIIKASLAFVVAKRVSAVNTFA